MDKQSIVNTQQYLTLHDIMDIFKCGKDKAYSIIRSIKHCTGDKLGISGKVLVTEYEAWNNAVNVKI